MIPALQASVSDSDLSGARSGVRRIEVTVDGGLKASRDGTCNAENACPESLSLVYAVNTDDLPDGYHVVTVRTEDGAHNIASRAVEVIVARRGPLAVPVGELRGNAGQAVTSAAPYALAVTGADQAARVKAVGVSYGQGQELARDESTCVAVLCPISRKASFQINTTAMPEGEQTLRAFSIDGLLRRTESQPWTVTVDRTPPSQPGQATVDFDPEEQVAVLSIPPGGDPPAASNGTPGSGVEGVQYRDQEPDGTWNDWQTVEPGGQATLYREEGDTFAMQTRTVDRSHNSSETRSSTHEVPRASIAVSDALKPPQRCVPPDKELGRDTWAKTTGFRYRRSDGTDITSSYDTKVRPALNLPDCRFAKTLNPAAPGQPLAQPRGLTQDGSPIIKTKKGPYAFGFRAVQNDPGDPKKRGDFRSGQILNSSETFVPVYDSYGNEFAFLKQPAVVKDGSWAVSDHMGEPTPGTPGTGHTVKGATDEVVELQIYGRGCMTATAPALGPMIFVNFKAIIQATEVEANGTKQRINFRGFMRAADLGPKLGKGKNRETGVSRATLTTWAATAEFDTGCTPKQFTERYKNLEPARADVPYQKLRPYTDFTSDGPPPGWPSMFQAWFAYQGDKLEEPTGFPFYANYNGYPSPEVDSGADEPRELKIERVREVPILANTTDVAGGGTQRAVLPVDQVPYTRWLGGFAESDPNAGCRPATSEGRRGMKPTFFAEAQDWRAARWYLVQAPGKLYGFVPVNTAQAFLTDPTCGGRG